MAANTTRLVIAGLNPGTLYDFRVRAVNRAGASAYTNIARASNFVDDPQPCVAGKENLCLAGGRFRVEVD